MYKYIALSILAVIGLYQVNEMIQEEYVKYVEQNRCISKHVSNGIERSNIKRLNNSCIIVIND